MSTSELIIKNLLYNKNYVKRVVPFLKPLYFEEEEEQRIVSVIKKVFLKYEFVPSISILKSIFSDQIKGITEDLLKKIINKLEGYENLKIDNTSLEYLIDITQEYFIRKDMYLSLIESSKIIIENKNSEEYRKIPDLIDSSLKISLRDKNIGHIYNSKESIIRQYKYYNEKEIRFETHLENFNRIIGGGFEKKTLNIFLGEPGIGKSRFLTDLSVYFIRKGMNVLYISLELSENKIYQRIDANLLDRNINELEKLSRSEYIDLIKNVQSQVKGILIIKEYPAESIDIYNIENLISDIKIKKDINIDILIVDYLTVLKTAKNIGIHIGNLYVNGKIISNELLSIAKKHNLILLTAIHLNRAGWGNLDVKMANVAESAGVLHNADFAAALTATDQMKERKRILLKVVKNRLFSVSEGSKVMIGFDDSRMRHHDINDEIEEIDSKDIEENDLEEFDFG